MTHEDLFDTISLSKYPKVSRLFTWIMGLHGFTQIMGQKMKYLHVR